MTTLPINESDVITRTQDWLVKAVIGLNLCPFAKSVHVKQQIRYVVSQASSPAELLQQVHDELDLLADADPEKIDTTLLIHPAVLTDFLDYNDFLDVADSVLQELGLEGRLQIASFHPDYQFAGTAADDIDNYTNRAPYPMLHLIREESIDKAVDAFPNADEIYEKNIATLRKLGLEGWRKMFPDSDKC